MTLALVLLSLVAPNFSAQAEILCRRDAEITPVNDKVDDDDGCGGSVLLQGISFECGQSADLSHKVPEFLRELNKNGREYCASYCKKRSKNGVKCRGSFTENDKCGYTVPAREAEQMGKRAPCNSNCGGDALIYCSLYHGSYLKVEPGMFQGMRPNCYCERAK